MYHRKVLSCCIKIKLGFPSFVATKYRLSLRLLACASHLSYMDLDYNFWVGPNNPQIVSKLSLLPLTACYTEQTLISPNCVQSRCILWPVDVYASLCCNRYMRTGARTSRIISLQVEKIVLWWSLERTASGTMCLVTTTCPTSARRAQVRHCLITLN